MTSINIRAKAESFGVRLEDAQNGHRRIAEYLAKHKDVPIHQRQIDAIGTLPEREMVAVIRMDGWDKMHPDLFTKDGIRR